MNVQQEKQASESVGEPLPHLTLTVDDSGMEVEVSITSTDDRRYYIMCRLEVLGPLELSRVRRRLHPSSWTSSDSAVLTTWLSNVYKTLLGQLGTSQRSHLDAAYTPDPGLMGQGCFPTQFISSYRIPE